MHKLVHGLAHGIDLWIARGNGLHNVDGIANMHVFITLETILEGPEKLSVPLE
jgi:hypothetical protein